MSGDEQRPIVERATILRRTVSTWHGLHHGGQDDRDEKRSRIMEIPESYREAWGW